MRRRIRSAALVPFHRHVLPQIAVDGALVALAYYLAFHLRFDTGLTHRYALLLERTIWWVTAGGVLVLVLSRVYLRSWSYSGQRDYWAILQGRRGDHAAGGGRRGGAASRADPPPARPTGHDRARSAQRGDRAVLPAAAGAAGGRAGARARDPRTAPAGRLPRRARGRARRPDRRRGRRWAAGGARDRAQPRARPRAGGLPRRRPAQARPAHRRREGAGRHGGRSAAHPRGLRARRSDHRDSLGARLDARARGARVPRARHPGADAADRVRAAAESRRRARSRGRCARCASRTCWAASRC